jgi:hypothetical protein
MAKIELADGGFEVDAATIANGLDLDASAVPTLMKVGEITSTCERGEGADTGRYRLTFFHGDRRFRITLDATGAILGTENAA